MNHKPLRARSLSSPDFMKATGGGGGEFDFDDEDDDDEADMAAAGGDLENELVLQVSWLLRGMGTSLKFTISTIVCALFIWKLKHISVIFQFCDNGYMPCSSKGFQDDF